MSAVTRTPYIPPPGAMQFEVTSGPDGKPVSFPLWVEPKKNRCYERSCNCGDIFRVLHWEIPDGLSKRANPSLPNGDVYVCACIGRIIE